MNLKACTFERLAFISLGFGRGAQVGKTSLLEVEFILRRKRRRWAYSFQVNRRPPPRVPARSAASCELETLTRSGREALRAENVD